MTTAERLFLPGVVLLCIALFSPVARATVDSGYVNDLTGQCVYIEDDMPYEPIGFRPCGERCSQNLDAYCRKLGYTYLGKDAPYTIEIAIAILLAGFFLVHRWHRKTEKQRKAP